jgi:hypothetical protein
MGADSNGLNRSGFVGRVAVGAMRMPLLLQSGGPGSPALLQAPNNADQGVITLAKSRGVRDRERSMNPSRR